MIARTFMKPLRRCRQLTRPADIGSSLRVRSLARHHGLATRRMGMMRIPQFSRGLTWQIFLATILGALFGIACHAFVPAQSSGITGILGMFITLFLRAIKMLI